MFNRNRASWQNFTRSSGRGGSPSTSAVVGGVDNSLSRLSISLCNRLMMISTARSTERARGGIDGSLTGTIPITWKCVFALAWCSAAAKTTLSYKEDALGPPGHAGSDVSAMVFVLGAALLGCAESGARRPDACRVLGAPDKQTLRLDCGEPAPIKPAVRLVVSLPGAVAWDSLVQTVEAEGKYVVAGLSSAVPRSFNATAATVFVRECGSCEDSSGTVPFLESSICGRCYFDQCPAHPVAYSHPDAPAANEVWSYHVGTAATPEDVYAALKASRDAVFYCRDCNRWNATSRVASFSVCAVRCLGAESGPPELDAYAAALLDPMFRPHRESPAPEITASVFLLVATTILVSGALLSAY